MVKLIRLATNNNGIFKSAFGSSIPIKPNGKIALLNLTFRTDFNVLTIDDDNNEVTFMSDVAVGGVTEHKILLTNKTYTSTTIRELVSDVAFVLNATVQLDNSIGATGVPYNSVSSAFDAYLENDLIYIVFRYAPFVNPFNNTSSQQPYPSRLLMKYKPASLDVTVTGSGGVETEVSQITGEPAVLLREHNALLIPGVTFSKGNGMYYARIADFADNGSGLQDNGAGIGLTNVEFFGIGGVDPGFNIPLAQCIYEVRFNRLTETYEYIVNGDFPLDSGVLPTVVSLGTSGSVAKHDVMFIEKNGPYIQVGVYQDVAGVATRQVFGTGTDLAIEGVDYWSYLFVRGAKTDIKLDMVNISINPFLRGGGNFPPYSWDEIGSSDASALANGYGDLTASVNPSPGFIMPKLLQTRWDAIPVKALSIRMSNNVWKALGYKALMSSSGYTYLIRTIGTTTGLIGWTGIWDANAVSEILGSDHFIVVSDTLQLDSYDASKVFYTEQDNTSGNVSFNPDTERMGRRKNILMTIPENNNEDGLVEFQTNTPIFIDINNVEPMNVRNLQFRILNKDFSSISTKEEKAVMTILLD